MLEPEFYTQRRENCSMDEPIIWIPNKTQITYAQGTTKPISYASGTFYLAVEFVVASEHGSTLGREAPEPVQTILNRCGVLTGGLDTKKTR